MRWSLYQAMDVVVWFVTPSATHNLVRVSFLLRPGSAAPQLSLCNCPALVRVSGVLLRVRLTQQHPVLGKYRLTQFIVDVHGDC